ncbi:MAG: barstar family protein [Candidatus Accumulibacter sp.]|jgi:hypothetical protein|nr:barstar family protein [Accumulibacter sp.]
MDQERFRALLPRADLAGIHRLPAANAGALRQAAESLNFACFEIDLREAGLEAALKTLGERLGFPQWYGANLDALRDCLADFSWNEAPGYVLLLSRAGAPRGQDESFARLNGVFASVIREWRRRGVPFWVFHDSRADGLAPPPILA